MTTDTTEKGLESLIVTAMTGRAWPEPEATDGIAESPAGYGGTGWLNGRPQDYQREGCLALGLTFGRPTGYLVRLLQVSGSTRSGNSLKARTLRPAVPRWPRNA